MYVYYIMYILRRSSTGDTITTGGDREGSAEKG